MSRAGDDAERSDEEERRMSVMNGREVARESRDAQVFEFGTAPGSAVVKIPVQGGPIGGIAISRDGSLLVVTNNGTDTVSVVGTDTCRVTQTVTSVNEPFAIAMGNAEPTARTSARCRRRTTRSRSSTWPRTPFSAPIRWRSV